MLIFFSVSCDISRFGLDIDLDAPKVRIPLTCNGNFVLDLGHFTLHTRVSSSFRILYVYHTLLLVLTKFSVEL